MYEVDVMYVCISVMHMYGIENHGLMHLWLHCPRAPSLEGTTHKAFQIQGQIKERI